MNKFEQLILNSPDHQVLNFVYGDDSDLLMTEFDGTYKMLSVRLAKQVFDAQQAEIDRLNNQLNQMEACYIEKKQECENLLSLNQEHEL